MPIGRALIKMKTVTYVFIVREKRAVNLWDEHDPE